MAEHGLNIDHTPIMRWVHLENIAEKRFKEARILVIVVQWFFALM